MNTETQPTPLHVVVADFVLDGVISAEHKKRLDTAAGKALSNQPPNEILVTGGRTAGEVDSQAQCAATYLREVRGFPWNQITHIDRGHDTLREVTLALAYAAQVGKKPVFITNRLQLWQIKLSIAMRSWWTGTKIEYETIATPLCDWRAAYILIRFAILPLTFFDPHGKRFPFTHWRRKRAAKPGLDD